jgi:hypothetical protein
MAIKFVNPQAITRVLSLKDDAIDVTKCDLKQYARDMDATKLALFPDSKPTWFYLKNILQEDMAEINDSHFEIETGLGKKDEKGKELAPRVHMINQNQMFIKYFRAGCTHVEMDGVKKELTEAVFTTIPLDIITEIGSMVMRRSSVEDETKKS